jgi:hypothetical protein
MPAALRPLEGLFGVILALEPCTDAVGLRALKDHGNPDVAALHVAIRRCCCSSARGAARTPSGADLAGVPDRGPRVSSRDRRRDDPNVC